MGIENRNTSKAFCRKCQCLRAMVWKKDYKQAEKCHRPEHKKRKSDSVESLSDSTSESSSDIFGNEVQDRHRSRKSTVQTDQPDAPGRCPADFWFRCATCGSDDLIIEYISMEEAILRNKRRKAHSDRSK